MPLILVNKDRIEPISVIKEEVSETKTVSIDYSKAQFYLRPATINDLELIHSWMQNELITCALPAVIGRQTWAGAQNWWLNLNNSIVLMVMVIESGNPFSFYCGRTIGMVEFYEWSKEYARVAVVIGDPMMWGNKLGYKIFDLALDYCKKNKGNTKLCWFMNRTNEVVMRIIQHEKKRANIKEVDMKDDNIEIYYEILDTKPKENI